MEQVRGDEAVRELIKPLLLHLAQDGLTELVINQPKVGLIETSAGWCSIEMPEMDLPRLTTLATSIASFSEQTISHDKPILSAILPDGERVQIVMPPAVPVGTISFSIRKPSYSNKSMEEYVQEGLFDKVIWGEGSSVKFRDEMPNGLMISYDDTALINLLRKNNFAEFFQQAVTSHKNIAVVGDTGSGKTTFMKSICQFIPQHERIITIEDVREIFISHSNIVHLLYSKGGQSLAKVTPADLITSCMRMKPDRVLLAELRGSESYDFLKLLTTGHSGSITSYHAASCQDALARFVLMAKEHIEAAAYQDVALKRLMMTAIDIVAHLKAVPIFENGVQIGKKRVMTEIYFDPIRKVQIAYES